MSFLIDYIREARASPLDVAIAQGSILSLCFPSSLSPWAISSPGGPHTSPLHVDKAPTYMLPLNLFPALQRRHHRCLAGISNFK